LFHGHTKNGSLGDKRGKGPKKKKKAHREKQNLRGVSESTGSQMWDLRAGENKQKGGGGKRTRGGGGGKQWNLIQTQSQRKGERCSRQQRKKEKGGQSGTAGERKDVRA